MICLYSKSSKEIDELINSPKYDELQKKIIEYQEKFLNISEKLTLGESESVLIYAINNAYSDIKLKEFISTVDIDPFLKYANNCYMSGNDHVLSKTDEVYEYMYNISKNEKLDRDYSSVQERTTFYSSYLLNSTTRFLLSSYNSVTSTSLLNNNNIEKCLNLVSKDELRQIFSRMYQDKSLTVCGDSRSIEEISIFLNKYELSDKVEYKTFDTFDEYFEYKAELAKLQNQERE